MNEDLRARTDRLLTTAATALGLADPRPAYRERLRQLKMERPDAFAKAIRHYEDVVMPAIAAEKEVIEAWIAYGGFIAGLSSPGRLVAVDPTGLAMPFAAPAREGTLVLHIPDENNAAVLVAVSPSAPTPAQQATLDLLVNGSLGLRSA